MLFFPSFILLCLALTIRGQLLTTGPICFQDCVLGSCVDITHTNCVCTQHAADIETCVIASCNDADQILAQQVQASTCANSNSTSTSSTVTSTSTFASSSTANSASLKTSSSTSMSPTTTLMTSYTAQSSPSVPPTGVLAVDPTSTSNATGGLSSAAKGGVVGGVVGGILLLVGCIGAFLFMKRHKARHFAISAPSYEEAVKYKPAEDGGRVLRYPEEAAVEELGGRLNSDKVDVS